VTEVHLISVVDEAFLGSPLAFQFLFNFRDG